MMNKKWITDSTSGYIKYIKQELEAFQDVKKSNKYSEEYLKELSNELQNRIQTIRKTKHEEIKSHILSERKSISESILNNSGKSNLDGIKVQNAIALLNGLGDTIKKSELEALANEFKDNYIVSKLIVKYAEENDMHIDSSICLSKDPLADIDKAESIINEFFGVNPNDLSKLYYADYYVNQLIPD